MDIVVLIPFNMGIRQNEQTEPFLHERHQLVEVRMEVRDDVCFEIIRPSEQEVLVGAKNCRRTIKEAVNEKVQGLVILTVSCELFSTLPRPRAR